MPDTWREEVGRNVRLIRRDVATIKNVVVVGVVMAILAALALML